MSISSCSGGACATNDAEAGEVSARGEVARGDATGRRRAAFRREGERSLCKKTRDRHSKGREERRHGGDFNQICIPDCLGAP